MSLDVSRAAECFERAVELLPDPHPERAGILSKRAAAALDAVECAPLRAFRDAQRVY